MGRIIFFTGKGGVGKTSVAAAHAAASADEGKKTLLVSTDMAHNLGDIFETEVGGHTRQAGENLDLLELDPDILMNEEFPNVSQAITSLMENAGSIPFKSGSIVMIPGFENLFSLLKIKAIYESGIYERIMVDCAPTGETLSLLKLPEMLTWYMEKFFPVGKMMVRVMTPVSKIKYKVTLPSQKAMNEFEAMHEQLVMLQTLFRNPEICSVRIVCIPEKMVVAETKRNYMYLNLYDYQVDGVFINRILPEETGSAFMDHWHEIQKQYISELETVFTEIPIIKIPWYAKEVRGDKAIHQLSVHIKEMPELFDVKCTTDREVYEAIKDGYRLAIKLPGCDLKDICASVHDMDLNLTLHNYHRCIPLPNTLRGARISEIDYHDDQLLISLICQKISQQDGKDGRTS